MMLIDTHCHLCDNAYADDWREVLSRAGEAGVGAVVNVGLDVPTSQHALCQAEEWEAQTWRGAGVRGPRMHVTVGMHPCEANQWNTGGGDAFRGTAAQLRFFTTHRAVVAIGEIGLDFHWTRVKPETTPSVEQQENVFRAQLLLAQENFLPVVIHSRDSASRCLEVIREEECEAVPGVFHCFAGALDEARAALDLGFHLGLCCNVTYPKAAELRELARFIPLDRLMIETDGPYLAPQAHRGKRNEPAYVAHAAATIAELRSLSVDAVTAATTENARALFGLR